MAQHHYRLQENRRSIRLTFDLPVVFTERKKWWLASCEALDVCSQGETREKAEENIVEALQLFIEACLKMGTLEQILKESGFVPGPKTTQLPTATYVNVPISFVTSQNAEARAG